jgi:hypothetical protein
MLYNLSIYPNLRKILKIILPVDISPYFFKLSFLIPFILSNRDLIFLDKINTTF